MTTPVAVKRRFRRHTRAAPCSSTSQRLQRVPPSAVPDDGAELLTWLEQAGSNDLLVLDTKRLVRDGEMPSDFQWRILRRARADAEVARYRYGNHRKDRLAQRQARQAKAVAGRAVAVGGEGNSREKLA